MSLRRNGVAKPQDSDFLANSQHELYIISGGMLVCKATLQHTVHIIYDPVIFFSLNKSSFAGTYCSYTYLDSKGGKWDKLLYELYPNVSLNAIQHIFIGGSSFPIQFGGMVKADLGTHMYVCFKEVAHE
mmetsp:Transcript_40693/g.53588  ORF Transcript_40693/g.53588 Transcript_40693/m.53588 type:complete len:129 (+) Transcript_40693:643-1029(+)